MQSCPNKAKGLGMLYYFTHSSGKKSFSYLNDIKAAFVEIWTMSSDFISVDNHHTHTHTHSLLGHSCNWHDIGKNTYTIPKERMYLRKAI